MYSDAAPGPAGDGQPPALPEQPAETGEHIEPKAEFSGAAAAAIVNDGKCFQVKSGNLDLFCQFHFNFIKESQIINVVFV